MNKIRIEELRKVESSNLDLVGFDGDKTFVQFKNGKLYEYPNTTREEFLGLVNSDSPGEAFFKSYKSKQEFNLLEHTTLEQKEARKLSISEMVNSEILFHQKNANTAGVNALKLLKSALIDNSKAKRSLSEDDVVRQYFKSLQKQQEEYLKVGASTKAIDYELILVEEFTPKEPDKMSDEDVQTAVLLYIGAQEYTMQDMGSIIRYLRVNLGNQNGKAIAKFVKEALNG